MTYGYVRITMGNLPMRSSTAGVWSFIVLDFARMDASLSSSRNKLIYITFLFDLCHKRL